MVYIPFFCWPTYRSDRSADFHARWLKRRGLTQGYAFLGVENSKLISNPWQKKSTQSQKFGKKTDLEIFAKNAPV